MADAWSDNHVFVLKATSARFSLDAGNSLIRRSTVVALGALLLGGTAYLVNRYVENKRLDAQATAATEYADRYVEVGELKSIKIADASIGGPLFAFTVPVTNNGPQQLFMVSAKYVASDIRWVFEHDDLKAENRTEPWTIVLSSSCMPADFRLESLCDPGETIIVGDTWVPTRHDKDEMFDIVLNQPWPDFDPSTLRFVGVEVILDD